MTRKEIEKEMGALEKEIALKLKNMRVEVGFTSPQQVSREIGAGDDTIYKIETCQSVPSKRIIYNLINVYRMNKVEIDELLLLRMKILNLRKKLKEQVNEYQ